MIKGSALSMEVLINLLEISRSRRLNPKKNPTKKIQEVDGFPKETKSRIHSSNR